MQGLASSAAAAGGHGAHEVVGAELVLGDDGLVVEEDGMTQKLDSEGLGLEFDGVSGSFPCWVFCMLLSPPPHLQQ